MASPRHLYIAPSDAARAACRYHVKLKIDVLVVFRKLYDPVIGDGVGVAAMPG